MSLFFHSPTKLKGNSAPAARAKLEAAPSWNEPWVKSFRGLILTLVLSLIAIGGFIPAGYGAEQVPLLEPAPNFKKSPAFKTLLKTEAGSKIYELHRIEYLMERISRSSCKFIRNRKVHDGKTAIMHMRWKYGRYQKEIETAEDFANKIANGSRKTREVYKVKLKNGKTLKSQDVLLNELKRLDEALKEASPVKTEMEKTSS